MATNAYQIWLTFDAGRQKIRFPVHPELIKIKQGSSNQSVDVVGLGEVTIMQEKPEAEVSWSCFFPSTTFPGVQVSSLTRPEELRAKINMWMGSKKPCRLIITGTTINMYCTIELFDCQEEGGAVGDLNYTIRLKEYRQPTIRQVKLDSATQAATVSSAQERTDNTITPSTYTIVKGDCLYNIAKRQLGNASKWPDIASLNGIKAPYTIYPGQVLKLPA